MVENGASSLTPAGQPITNPPGNFLQIAGGQVNRLQQGADEPCDRIHHRRGGRAESPPETTFRVAFTDFNLQAGTGFKELRTADQDTWRSPAQATQFGGQLSISPRTSRREHFDSGQHALVAEPATSPEVAW